MANLRFSYIVASSLFYVMYAVPKANYMLSHKDKYTEEERFAFACKIMDHMRKRGRTQTRVYGINNIPEEGAVYYSNHQGKYDALGILLALKKPCGALWEKKQATRFLSKQVCGLIGGVPIDLEDMRDKARAITEVTERLSQGDNMLIFPEGGYDNNHNELQEFQAGCFHCALRSKSTMVPVVIYDAYKSMNSNTFERVTTQIHFLKPITFEEYGSMKKPQMADYVKGIIAQQLNKIEAGELGEPDFIIK